MTVKCLCELSWHTVCWKKVLNGSSKRCWALVSITPTFKTFGNISSEIHETVYLCWFLNFSAWTTEFMFTGQTVQQFTFSFPDLIYKYTVFYDFITLLSEMVNVARDVSDVEIVSSSVYPLSPLSEANFVFFPFLMIISWLKLISLELCITTAHFKLKYFRVWTIFLSLLAAFRGAVSSFVHRIFIFCDTIWCKAATVSVPVSQ